MSLVTLEARAVEIRLEGRSVDGAEHLGSAVFHPHTVRPLGHERGFRLGLEAVSVGDITVGTIEYTQAARIDTGSYDDSYHVNLPVDGTLRTAIGDEYVRATPQLAAVYRRDVPTVLEGFDDGERVLALKIKRHALEDQLKALGGEPPTSGIHFAPTLDLHSSWGREWKWHMDVFARQLQDPGVLLQHPVLAGAITDGLLTTLLLATSHPDRERIASHAGTPAAASTIQRVADLMHHSPELQYRAILLSELTGTTPRAVQLGFRREFGVTPHDYLRSLRLQRVRSELCEPESSRPIAEVAHAWGFAHAGRFSADYARAFGELPSATYARVAAIRNAKSR